MTPDQFTAEVSKKNTMFKQYALLKFQKKVLCKFFNKEISPGLVHNIFKDNGVGNKMAEVCFRGDGIAFLEITNEIVDVITLLKKGVTHSFIKRFLTTDIDRVVFKMKGLKEWILHTSINANNNYSPMISFEGDGSRIILEPLVTYNNNKRSIK